MFLAKLLTFTHEWSIIRRSTWALCAFSDRELADLGLTRLESAERARRDRWLA